MRHRSLIVAPLVAGTLLVGVTAAGAACWSPEQAATAEGRLSTGRFEDAAGRPETAYILALASPVCLDGPDEFDKVEPTRELHLAPESEGMDKTFKRLVGKTVVVRGTPFGAHTAHHHAPIVMMVSTIAPR